MHPTASALLAAHRQHLLAQFAADNVANTLSREINAFLDWSHTRPINAVVKVEDIQFCIWLKQPLTAQLTIKPIFIN